MLSLQHMQEYAKYAAIAGPTVAEYGGEFLARGGDATQVPTELVCLFWPVRRVENFQCI